MLLNILKSFSLLEGARNSPSCISIKNMVSMKRSKECQWNNTGRRREKTSQSRTRLTYSWPESNPVFQVLRLNLSWIIQGVARNVIPLIVHVTHFYYYKSIMTSGTELILIGWKIVPNEEYVQCDHRFASQPLANEPLHSSQFFDTSLQKARGTTSLCGP